MDTWANGEKQFLTIWNNSKKTVIESPIKPYFYSKEIISTAQNDLAKNLTFLYEKDYTGPIYKNSFNTTRQLSDNRIETSCESHTTLRDRIFINRPEILAEYANTDELKIMSIDIETDTYMTFPNAHENAIIAIGLQFDDKPIEIYMSETHNNDKPILKKLIERIQDEDPDIIVTYNGTFFDIPYITTRMEINKLSTAKLGRSNRDIWNKTNLKGEITENVIDGRVHYDLFKKSVLTDQNIFKWSPPNRSMKTISKLYGLDEVVEEPPEIMGNMRSIVNSDELHRYLYSDIRATTFLRKLYFPLIMYMANYLKISVDAAVNSSASYPSKIMFHRAFTQRNIISDKTVGGAYPWLSHNKAGGLIETKTRTFLPNGIRDIDAISLYPNIIRLLHLSPETTDIVKVEDKVHDYEAWWEDNILMLSIPDTAANKQIVISVDWSKKGFLSTFVDELFEERMILKKKLKTLEEGTPEYQDVDLNQHTLKILLNSATGVLGEVYASHGSLASYIAITGTGRFLLREIANYMGDFTEINTDGIWIAKDASDKSLEDINEHFEKFTKEFFGVPKNYIWWEEETFKAGYWHKSKQYLLLTNNDQVIIHGAAFKSSNTAKLFRAVIDDLAYKKLTQSTTYEDIDRWLDSSEWTLPLLKKRNKCKRIEEYKSKSAVGVQLINQYQKRFDITLSEPTTLEYVKTSSKYGGNQTLVTIFDQWNDYPDIDIEHYVEMVEKAITRLGLEDMLPKNRFQTSLFDFN